MTTSEELQNEYFAEIDRARFSLIAAQLLCEEIDKIEDFPTLWNYKRRHKKHLREMYRHLRKVKKLRRKLERLEKKESRTRD